MCMYLTELHTNGTAALNDDQILPSSNSIQTKTINLQHAANTKNFPSIQVSRLNYYHVIDMPNIYKSEYFYK
jgi:hypothetical protein